MEKTQGKVLQKLFEIARSISSALDIDTLLKRIGDAAEELTDSTASSIMLLDEDREHLSFKTASGEKAGGVKRLKVKVGEGIAGTVAKEKKPMIVADVSKDARFRTTFDKSSGFQTKSILAVPLMIGDELLGVAEVLNKKDNASFTEEDREILESMASLASVSIVNAKFAEDQKNFFVYIIEILVQAIESREPRMTGHTWRVAQTATALGRALGLEGQEYKDLYYGALVHDIGYLSSAKDSPLLVNVDKRHPIIGWEMVHKINILSGAASAARSHHENHDGTGYPEQLKGEGIPLIARIVSLAEFVDDMHLAGYSEEKINEMVESNIGKKFDPEIAKVYLKEIAPQKEEVTAKY
ncbi:MAG: hypothetical protein AUJ85_03870 [Elusimicrobia bacterium CG1_02_37_114]|nr:MAG: hypothetical protein AUJ85_03870 [Elusimicrobia bacterium CG1_02_37_114]PIV53484.1 MAG: hypothetical protein COS17_03600 [Elusimicrobia bacterium CG02_land_8_20_14_3_00_37_13]PIZ13954.1 MAG: hypothetical protein COY53_02165 [Elusimicrobia bacterium CG_4_10_14_0_8_um_filter_37_32]